MDWTHDPNRRSFLETDRSFARSSFPIQNLPFGVFHRPDGAVACGVAIGDHALDVTLLESEGLLPSYQNDSPLFGNGKLNAFASQGPTAWREVRKRLSELLDSEETRFRDDQSLRNRALIPLESVVMQLPFRIGDYTDFYSSREHATNVGTMFRGKDKALQPNWLHLPVAYHGRASSVIPSGTRVVRPHGQTRPDLDQPPIFGPSKALDFELEMGVFIGTGNKLGTPISIDQAQSHLFGMVIVNDWSARDIQRWEYVPLGPFLAKNFATSISPWVVTFDALEPFRCSGPEQQPLLEYLAPHRSDLTFDIELEVAIDHGKLESPHTICRSNFKYLYWSQSQQVAHHTVTGCDLNPGDLLASGTISGATPDSYGSMLELGWKGERPLSLPDGSVRSMLQDGDSVVMKAACRGEHYDIGFGELRNEILPANP